MGKYVRTLSVSYDTEISNWEIPLFRGAVVDAIGLSSSNILFHNHLSEDAFRYGYPLIQYKRQSERACIVAIDDGVDIIGQFVASGTDTLQLGEREVSCKVAHIRPSRVLVQLWQSMFQYRLRKWMPFSAKNYQLFLSVDDEAERKSLLERILKGNLLAMLKGLGIWLEDELIVNIKFLSNPYLLRYKGVEMMAFNVDFESNLSIPVGIGIGRHVSVGFGNVTLKREEAVDLESDNENQ